MFYRKLSADYKKKNCKYYQKGSGTCSNPNYKLLCCNRCIGFKNKNDKGWLVQYNK